MSSVQTQEQAVQEAGPQPFEIWVVEAIQNTKREDMNALADLIRATLIPANHHKIYEEWEWRCGSSWRSDVLEHIYEQQKIAEAKAKT